MKNKNIKKYPYTLPYLSKQELYIIQQKGTEAPFTGEYYNNTRDGVYFCKQCGQALYVSTDKFNSGCGWPSFDDFLPNAVEQYPDKDGLRTEIVCSNCKAHLGHVFVGEGFTQKNTRHCVNSASIIFLSNQELEMNENSNNEVAIFAGGCFWGIEHLMASQPGVLKAVSGYTGGITKNPTYQDVCSGRTGHAEAVEVTYDPSKTSFETLARLFFESHDPTQKNRQGPDVGTQYRSAIFYLNKEQKEIADSLVSKLEANGYPVATDVVEASDFYPAEEYHQSFFDKNPNRSCSIYPVKRFSSPYESDEVW